MFQDFCLGTLEKNTSLNFFQNASQQPQIYGVDSGAAGDFILASRQAWYDVGGFPEVARCWLDGTVLKQMRYKGYKQIVIPNPCGAVFHLQHGGGLRLSRQDMGVNGYEQCLDQQALVDREQHQRQQQDCKTVDISNDIERHHNRLFADCIPPNRTDTSQLIEWADNPDWGFVNSAFVEY